MCIAPARFVQANAGLACAWKTTPRTAPKITCRTRVIMGAMIPMAIPKIPAPAMGITIIIMPSQAPMPNKMPLVTADPPVETAVQN